MGTLAFMPLRNISFGQNSTKKLGPYSIEENALQILTQIEAIKKISRMCHNFPLDFNSC